ncbi:acyl carrier protein, partial [Pseudomonas sp. JUb42]|uniref:phosphopantetheine-binding protein n=1 Tax=Pseudomonas sp. JUb42 TaxID=2940611 RepID=UPI00216A9BD4
GDLARYRADGAIEYAGRLDHQVKIRGLRIELGEIDARAQEYPAVREAVVIDIDGPLGKQLVGYLVPSEEGADPREGLKVHLKAGLPDYMVPNHWILLAAMPLSPNGKLDRKALPAPDATTGSRDYLAPEGALEIDVARVWAQTLLRERISLNDNFFELGGHSLLAARMMSTIRSELGLDVPLRLLFEYPCLNDFVQAIQTQATGLSETGLAEIEQMMNEWAEV